MRIAPLAILLPFLIWAQSPKPTKHPQIVGLGYMSQTGMAIEFASANKLTADANVATKQQRVNSVSNFARTFASGGASYPFTMVGNDPKQGGTTKIGTSLVMIQFFFDEFSDMNGNNIVLDASTRDAAISERPELSVRFAYATGNTQFSDSVQRAEFYNVMKPGWHTLLAKPRVLPTVQIEVPVGLSFVFQAGQGGPYFALIDDGFFVSQLNTILQFEPLRIGRPGDRPDAECAVLSGGFA